MKTWQMDQSELDKMLTRIREQSVSLLEEPEAFRDDPRVIRDTGRRRGGASCGLLWAAGCRQAHRVAGGGPRGARAGHRGLLTCLLEVVSAMDLVTDIVVFWEMMQHFHVYWSTITRVSLVAPYLVAYAAAMKLLLRNRVFDRVYKPSSSTPWCFSCRCSLLITAFPRREMSWMTSAVAFCC